MMPYSCPVPQKLLFAGKQKESSVNLPAVSFTKGPNGGQSSVGNGQDKLWNSLEQIDQLVKDSKSEKSCSVSQKSDVPFGHQTPHPTYPI